MAAAGWHAVARVPAGKIPRTRIGACRIGKCDIVRSGVVCYASAFNPGESRAMRQQARSDVDSLPPWLSDLPTPPPGLPMTTDRLDWCRQVLGWSSLELARRIATSDASVRQMLRGTRPIPDTLANWMEQLAALMLTAPHQPVGWRSWQ